MKNSLKHYWLSMVHIKPKEGFKMKDLIEFDEENTDVDEYIGAWANVIIKANNINEALDIIPLGLAEKSFDVDFIDKIENIQSLIDADELHTTVLDEIQWLQTTNYGFLISDRLFPYVN